MKIIFKSINSSSNNTVEQILSVKCMGEPGEVILSDPSCSNCTLKPCSRNRGVHCTVTFTGNHMAHHACFSTPVVGGLGANDHFCVTLYNANITNSCSSLISRKKKNNLNTVGDKINDNGIGALLCTNCVTSNDPRSLVRLEVCP